LGAAAHQVDDPQVVLDQARLGVGQLGHVR
jgi:hypothetical protein